jgi:hypothetical protein
MTWHAASRCEAGAVLRVVLAVLLATAACANGKKTAGPDERTWEASTATLHCAGLIDVVAAPPMSYEAIAEAVALPTSSSATTALQTSVHDGAEGLRLFAKAGLLVKTGAEATLVVPEAWRDRLAIGWGNTSGGHPAAVLEVGPCEGPGEWLVYPGGFFVEDASCVPLLISDGGSEHRVHVGVGAPCQGQEPPPKPSDV